MGSAILTAFAVLGDDSGGTETTGFYLLLGRKGLPVRGEHGKGLMLSRATTERGNVGH